jgi:hypothetical protein
MTDLVQRLRHPAECPACGTTYHDDTLNTALTRIGHLTRPTLQTILDQPQHHLLEPHTTTAPAARPNHG